MAPCAAMLTRATMVVLTPMRTGSDVLHVITWIMVTRRATTHRPMTGSI
jgi:hypothetical protein